MRSTRGPGTCKDKQILYESVLHLMLMCKNIYIYITHLIKIIWNKLYEPRIIISLLYGILLELRLIY